jgi:hypothetical protein
MVLLVCSGNYAKKASGTAEKESAVMGCGYNISSDG